MSISFDISKQLGSFKLAARGSFDGGVLGVFGPSGSGKTTLLKCLAGFVRPDAGSITVQERRYFEADTRIHVAPHLRRTGMVFQDALLFPHLNVSANVYYGMSPEADKPYVRGVLELLNLDSLMSRDPLTLSGGEQKRVALARILLHKPDVLLLDEPLASLDLAARWQIILYLKALQRRFRFPVIYVTHSPSEMIALADRVLVLENGKSGNIFDRPDDILNRVLTSAGQEDDIENGFELPVKSLDPSGGLAVLDLGGQELKAVYHDGQIKPRLRIGIRARDIIVARAPVTGISARNCLTARLNAIVRAGQHVWLEADCAGQIVRAGISASACDELGLKTGQDVYFIIKAGNIYVFE